MGSHWAAICDVWCGRRGTVPGPTRWPRDGPVAEGQWHRVRVGSPAGVETLRKLHQEARGHASLLPPSSMGRSGRGMGAMSCDEVDRIPAPTLPLKGREQFREHAHIWISLSWKAR